MPDSPRYGCHSIHGHQRVDRYPVMTEKVYVEEGNELVVRQLAKMIENVGSTDCRYDRAHTDRQCADCERMPS